MFRLTKVVFSGATDKIAKSFTGALPNSQMVASLSAALKPHGYGSDSLLATSLCCDEVNRTLEKDLIGEFGDNFSMGGLAGFPFGGVTSFGAMAHHIPTGGSCLIVYGPHVGVDTDGVVGQVNRRGREGSGACCGSAAAAAGFVSQQFDAGNKDSPTPKAPLDAQQAYVGKLLLPYAERLSESPDPAVELPFALFDAQKAFMNDIVAAASGEVAGEGKIALLGGIQINTPDGDEDYFLPIEFEIRDNKNKVVKKL